MNTLINTNKKILTTITNDYAKTGYINDMFVSTRATELGNEQPIKFDAVICTGDVCKTTWKPTTDVKLPGR